MTELEQRRRLARIKTLATGLLISMILVFAATHLWGGELAWVGFVRSFAEAAMVGALADWFAVTALFRHPMGLPIPHTAIVPRRKNEIGDSLARFVRDNFLNRAALAPRLEHTDFAAAGGRWLATPENAAKLTDDTAAFLRWLLAAIDDRPLREFLSQNLDLSLRRIRIAPMAGRVLDLLASADRHQALMDIGVRIAREQLEQHRYLIRVRIEEQSPWWLPGFVDRELYNKIVEEIDGLLDRIGDDASHPAREQFNEAVRDLIERMKSDPELIARGERLKNEILGEPAVQEYLANLWLRVREYIADESLRPDSALRERLHAGLVALGEALLVNGSMRAEVNRWLGDALLYVVSQYRDEMVAVISETVRAWDPRATAERVELQVGRDLQFIRINGTLVGGLAGIAIHTIVLLTA